MKKVKISLVLIGLFLFFAVIFPFFETIWISFHPYRVLFGLHGGTFSGWNAFQEALEIPEFFPALRNTLSVGMLSIALGALYIGLTLFGLSRVKRASARIFFCCIVLLPAMFPVSCFFPYGQRIWNGLWYLVSYEVLSLCAPFIVMGAFCVWSQPDKKNIFRMVGIYVSFRLMTLFSTDLNLALCLPDYPTIDLVIYKATFQQMLTYSVAAALYLIKLVLQLIPSIIGILLLYRITKTEKSEQIERKSRIAFPMLAILILPAMLFGSLLLQGADGEIRAMHRFILPSLFIAVLFTGGFLILSGGWLNICRFRKTACILTGILFPCVNNFIGQKIWFSFCQVPDLANAVFCYSMLGLMGGWLMFAANGWRSKQSLAVYMTLAGSFFGKAFGDFFYLKLYGIQWRIASLGLHAGRADYGWENRMDGGPINFLFIVLIPIAVGLLLASGGIAMYTRKQERLTGKK